RCSSREAVADPVANAISFSAKCWSEWQDLNLRPPRPERGAAVRVGPPGQGGCVSWENLRNLLKRNGPILHQLGKKPREINVAPGTHAAQQHACYSITSSARASSIGGTSRPSAFAVLRLITSSYLVGACTGRSAGFSPLRMRST